MWEEILRAIPVYFATMLKFIFGPLGGYTAGLNLLTTILTTVFGMMSVVILFTYSGNWFKEKVLHRFIRKRDPSSARDKAREKKLARMWKKYGLTGIALLTPIILTPIGGTLLAVSSGSPKEKIIFYMFISAAAWAVIFSVSIYFFGNEVLPDFIK